MVWLIAWALKLGRTASQAPWLDRATGSALKMGRATGWDLCLGTATSRNAVCQDLSAVAVSPTSTSPPLSDLQWLSPTDSPSYLYAVWPKWSFWEAAHNAGGARRPPRALFFQWRNHRPRGPSRCSAVPVWRGAMWSECS